MFKGFVGLLLKLSTLNFFVGDGGGNFPGGDAPQVAGLAIGFS